MISIRRQLTRELLGAVLVLGGVGFLAMYWAARDAAIEQFDDALEAKALAIGSLTSAGPRGLQVEFTDRFFRGFDDRRPRDFFEMWDAAGRPLARSKSLASGDLLRAKTPKGKPVHWNLTLPSGRPGRAIGWAFEPKTAGTGTGPTIQLVVASDRSKLDEGLRQLAALAAAAALVLLAATLWLIPRVLRRGLQPLERLGEQVAAVDAGSLGTRFAVEGLPAELKPIAVRLNELFSRLRQSFERERRFSADLAHELRTPLAELRSLLECALKWPESRERSTDGELLAVTAQMEAMVAHMLALARGEQRQVAVRREPIALDELVRGQMSRFASRAADRRLRVAQELPPATAEADPALLRSILGNLLENAVDYASEGGAIEIRIEESGAEIRLEVANATDELAPADLPRLFERFWRKEAARSGGRHVGLGLALARTFAEAMGWSLTAAMPRPHWLALTLRGPRPAAGKPDSAVRP